VHFNYSSLFSDAQVEKVGNPKKNVKTERAVGSKPECHEIDPKLSKDRICLREIILRFEVNL
jgi:hypothetical protein